MDMNDIINTKVMIIIGNSQGLGHAGIEDNHFYAKVVGQDSMGIWVENPKFVTVNIRREDGNIIPPEKRVKEEHVANVLIPWSNIRSVIQFPNRKGFIYEDEYTKHIGSGAYL